MFEIAGGIVLAYLIIRFRHSIVALPLLLVAAIVSLFVNKSRHRNVFDRPKPGTDEHLQWANREGVWQFEPVQRPTNRIAAPQPIAQPEPQPKKTFPPKPPKHSPEYVDWANREGRWAGE